MGVISDRSKIRIAEKKERRKKEYKKLGKNAEKLDYEIKEIEKILKEREISEERKKSLEKNFLFLILKELYNNSSGKLKSKDIVKKEKIKKIMKERELKVLTLYLRKLISLKFVEIKNRGCGLSLYWPSSKGTDFIQKVLSESVFNSFAKSKK